MFWKKVCLCEPAHHQKEARKEALPFENIFMGICREGKVEVHQYYGNTKLHCRYLHHRDPYLKLGPFKEDQISAIPYVVIFRDIFRAGSCIHHYWVKSIFNFFFFANLADRCLIGQKKFTILLYSIGTSTWSGP